LLCIADRQIASLRWPSAILGPSSCDRYLEEFQLAAMEALQAEAGTIVTPTALESLFFVLRKINHPVGAAVLQRSESRYV
jgi:hypothetical protein